MRKKALVLSSVPIVLLFALGCSDDRDDPTAPSSMSIEIVNLHDGDAVPAGSVPMQVRVTGMMMDCGHMGGESMMGSGHWRLEMDDRMMGMPCTESMMMDLTGVAPGEHTFVCTLMQNDHMPYSGVGSASVKLVVGSR